MTSDALGRSDGPRMETSAVRIKSTAGVGLPVARRSDAAAPSALPGERREKWSDRSGRRYKLPDPPAAAERKLNVGIDFGTSTTKVCLREARGEDENVVTYSVSLDDAAHQEIAGLLCPSLVTITRDGALYFGFEAERRREKRDATALDHLKICVGCESESQARRLAGCRLIDASGKSCGAGWRFSRGGTIIGVKATELVTLFLAWVMGEMGRRVPPALRGSAPIELTYNVGVPLDQLSEASDLRDAYRVMTFQAWRLSGGVRQGIELDRALAWLDQVKAVAVPPPEHRRVQLCPESGAALVGFVSSPRSRPGMYGLVDIGAWTTEISFFRLTQREVAGGGTAFVSFYSGGTYRVGGTNVDERVLRALWDLWQLSAQPGAETKQREALTELRRQREGNTFGTTTVCTLDELLKRIPPRSVLEFPRDWVGERLRDRFREEIKKAGEIDRAQSAWQGFPIYVFGGGAQETALWCRLAETTPVASGVQRFPSVQNVEGTPASLAGRFLVAAGLALPIPLWHEAHGPRGIEPVTRLRARPLPDSEELGYVER